MVNEKQKTYRMEIEFSREQLADILTNLPIEDIVEMIDMDEMGDFFVDNIEDYPTLKDNIRSKYYNEISQNGVKDVLTLLDILLKHIKERDITLDEFIQNDLSELLDKKEGIK